MVCMKCVRKMEKVMIGIWTTEWTDDPNNGGIPVFIHKSDLYECPECKQKVISNFRDCVYITEHNQEIFNSCLKKSVIDYF